MSVEKVKQGSMLTIGTKQTTKIVGKGMAAEVYLAKDADAKISARIVSLCRKTGTPIVYVESMKTLGKACGIGVGAAMAASIKD